MVPCRALSYCDGIHNTTVNANKPNVMEDVTRLVKYSVD